MKILIYFCVLVMPVFCDNFEFNNPEVAEQLYIKLFKRRRSEQLEAVKSFKKLSSYDKQYSMIMLMAEKVFTVIQDSRAIIEASGYIPGISPFPMEEKIRDSLSNILENTALFSEIIIRFPDMSVSVLKINNNWDVLLQWSIAFCSQNQHLLDKSTNRLLNLVSQELNHTERQPNYVNPYRIKNKSDVTNDVDVKLERKKKKKEIKKGPRLTNSHTEL